MTFPSNMNNQQEQPTEFHIKRSGNTVQLTATATSEEMALKLFAFFNEIFEVAKELYGEKGDRLWTGDRLNQET
jgi:hypothetical protein